MKQHLITIALVVAGVIIANWVSSKLGLDSYEVEV